MIADVRTYTLVPRKFYPYLKLLEQYAIPIMPAHGMVLDRYFISKIGLLNQVIHIWNYESLAEFERIRNARDADPKWTEYLAKTEGMVLSQENKVMGNASFSPKIWMPISPLVEITGILSSLLCTLKQVPSCSSRS